MKSLLRLATLATVLNLTLISPVRAQTGQATGACGWMPVDNGAKAHFGGFADVTDGGLPTGYLIYRDPDVNLSLRSIEITNVTNIGCLTTMTGNAHTNHGLVSFMVNMQDNGTPGKGVDTFEITIPDLGYSRSGTLGGGEIDRDGLTCP